VRIIAGTLKGRRLESPRWPGLRPTSDRLRETLFNVLGPRVAGARVLDLAAGTGAVGIEALSRGAAQVTFVEADARACRLIASNLARCGVDGGYTIVRSTVAEAGARLRGGFDIVFLDLPYADPAFDRGVTLAAAQVAAGGVLVVEHARRRPAPPAAGALGCVRALVAGDSALAFYRADVSGDEGPTTVDPV
jgi:16S rRNA (guanine(966)-N(2))-methyltransferase RsmD